MIISTQLISGCVNDKVMRLNWENMRWIKIMNCNNQDYIIFQVQNANKSKIKFNQNDTLRVDGIIYENVVFTSLKEAGVDFNLADSTARKGQIYLVGYRIDENDNSCVFLSQIKKIRNVGVFFP